MGGFFIVHALFLSLTSGMAIPPLTDEATKVLIAAWGAITGSIAILIHIHNWWKDKARVVITGEVCWKQCNRTNTKGIQVVVEVVNHGRRVIVIKKAGLMFPRVKGEPFGVFQARHQADETEISGSGVALEEGRLARWESLFNLPSMERYLHRRWFLFAEDTYGNLYKIRPQTDLKSLKETADKLAQPS